MCGRFTLAPDLDDIQDELDLKIVPADFVPRYNVAPTQPVAVVRDPIQRTVEWMRWGLIPSWAKDPSIGAHMINARAETLMEKPSFRSALSSRRCLILADGFYEWQKQSGKVPSIPYYFSMQSHRPFFFAGLWDEWKSAEGKVVTSCTIITCAPNEIVKPVHERMPVLFSKETAMNWLKPATPTDLLALLRPFPAAEMKGYPVRSLVNSPFVDARELLEKAEG